MNTKLIIDSTSNHSIIELRDALCKEINEPLKNERPIVFLCIGTDRSTGDCLGPLVGQKLKFLIRDRVYLYGNLEYPIHAKNICETINTIKSQLINPFIVAIDACLGNIQNIGKIYVERKPLNPGAALNKDLPPIGDISITGIVNISGTLEFMILQNTRLYTVMTLADVISKGIYHSIIKTFGGRNSKNLKTKTKLMELKA